MSKSRKLITTKSTRKELVDTVNRLVCLVEVFLDALPLGIDPEGKVRVADVRWYNQIKADPNLREVPR